eukprot:362467-Rhodomonas_salina.1
MRGQPSAAPVPARTVLSLRCVLSFASVRFCSVGWVLSHRGVCAWVKRRPRAGTDCGCVGKKAIEDSLKRLQRVPKPTPPKKVPSGPDSVLLSTVV